MEKQHNGMHIQRNMQPKRNYDYPASVKRIWNAQEMKSQIKVNGKWKINPEYLHQWRKKHPNYERERYRTNRDRRLAINKRWHKRNREKVNKLAKEYIQRNPEKLKAHNFVITNNLPLNAECEFCGSTKKLQRHHPDYDEPAIYVTCCIKCHMWIEGRTDIP